MTIMLREQQHRIEQVLALARVFLAGASLLAVHLDSGERTNYVMPANLILLAYLTYSVIVLVWLRASSRLQSEKIPFILHAVDILGPATIVLFSDGPNSPFLIFLVFALVAAGYRWGLRATLATTVSAILVVVARALFVAHRPLQSEFVIQTGFDTNRLVTRIAYLLAVGFLIGHLADGEKRLRMESTTIARLLGKVRPEQGLRRTLQALLGDLLHSFGADSVLLAVEEVRWKRLYVWEVSHGSEPHDLKLHLCEADPARELVCHFPLPGEFVYAVRRRSHAGSHLVSTLALDADGHPENGSTSVFPDHPLWREADAVMAASCAFGEEWRGRLFLINPRLRGTRFAGLRFLQNVVRQLNPAVSGTYMLRRLRSKAGALERIRVAQELHDGAIQSLIALEMQIHSLRHQPEHSVNGLGAELANIQQSLHQEIIGLRELMIQIRPLNLDPRQFVEFMADLVARFQRETGVSAAFVTDMEEVRLPAYMLRELGRIVQEALINIRKHGEARHILVSLGHKDGLCRIVIDDDGRGFGFAGRFSLPQLEANRQGPMVIKERIRNIGGGLTIESIPGRGARLEIYLPSPKAQASYA